MGERVVIRPATAKKPAPAVPLGYGHGGKRFDAWRRFRSTCRVGASDAWQAFRAGCAGLVPAVEQTVRRLGGWQQLGFAAGLAFILGGIGFSLGSPQAVLMMWLGGLLVGLCLRLPR